MTWTGKISDSMCGTTHAGMQSSHAGLNDHDCTVACVKAGAKYVFVSKGKVYKIANQDKIVAHAGEKVTVTGSVKDDTITIEDVK